MLRATISACQEFERQAWEDDLGVDGGKDEDDDVDTLASPNQRPQRDDEDDEDLDKPPYLPELTLSTTHLLHSVFSTLAEFTPARAPIFQKRFESIGGNDADATERIIESVRNRIQVVYGPDHSPIRVISAPEDPPSLPYTTDTSTLSHRTQLLTSSRTDLSSSSTRYGVSDDSLSDIPVINGNSTIQQSTRRKQGRPPAASYGTGAGTGRKRRNKVEKEEKQVETQVESANTKNLSGRRFQPKLYIIHQILGGRKMFQHDRTFPLVKVYHSTAESRPIPCQATFK
ncbi:hypothetical protein V5O48_013907 [Marasmius crinis-equi]|uniref:Uncharacterized protein n=1 Tax=Marasmius crinis-equi TaxID=585013 RepID=A0ABR3EZ48_9AGAR